MSYAVRHESNKLGSDRKASVCRRTMKKQTDICEVVCESTSVHKTKISFACAFIYAATLETDWPILNGTDRLITLQDYFERACPKVFHD